MSEEDAFLRDLATELGRLKATSTTIDAIGSKYNKAKRKVKQAIVSSGAKHGLFFDQVRNIVIFEVPPQQQQGHSDTDNVILEGMTCLFSYMNIHGMTSFKLSTDLNNFERSFPQYKGVVRIRNIVNLRKQLGFTYDFENNILTKTAKNVKPTKAATEVKSTKTTNEGNPAPVDALKNLKAYMIERGMTLFNLSNHLSTYFMTHKQHVGLINKKYILIYGKPIGLEHIEDGCTSYVRLINNERTNVANTQAPLQKLVQKTIVSDNNEKKHDDDNDKEKRSNDNNNESNKNHNDNHDDNDDYNDNGDEENDNQKSERKYDWLYYNWASASFVETIDKLSQQEYIGLDMEFTEEVSLIQVSYKSDEGTSNASSTVAILFDILECPELLEAGLMKILTSKKPRKLIHDPTKDYRHILDEYNAKMQGLVDTQIAYNLLRKKSISYKVGMNRMLSEFGAQINSLKESIDHNRWGDRPLSQEHLDYAAMDVAYLLDAFENMKEENLDIVETMRLTQEKINVDEYPALDETASPLNDLPVDTQRMFTFNELGELQLIEEGDHNNATSCDAIDKDKLAEMEQDQKRDRERLFSILPPKIKASIMMYESIFVHMYELVFDLGRVPLLRFTMESNIVQGKVRYESFDKDCLDRHGNGSPVTEEDIEYIHKQLGQFTSDNRTGISESLHRISRRQNNYSKTIGFTMRIGRMIPGSTMLVTDLVKQKKSILLIGMPGVGKTTALREFARILSTDMMMRVEVIDTSNEIAGEGDVPHASIGRARRMMVKDRLMQHQIMIEAVQNHTPQVLIIDEIGTRKEAKAASDITQRGVKIIGTAHGIELAHLIKNQELNTLIGGIQAVILGDDVMRKRKLQSKTVTERVGPCAFDAAIELRSMHSWVVYSNLSQSVDAILAGKKVPLEIRTYDPHSNRMYVKKAMEYTL